MCPCNEVKKRVWLVDPTLFFPSPTSPPRLCVQLSQISVCTTESVLCAQVSRLPFLKLSSNVLKHILKVCVKKHTFWMARSLTPHGDVTHPGEGKQPNGRCCFPQAFLPVCVSQESPENGTHTNQIKYYYFGRISLAILATYMYTWRYPNFRTIKPFLMTMWSFPEMGTPQKSSKLDNFFLLKPIGFGDPPHCFHMGH